VVLFNCANGNKYPLVDRARRMKLAEMHAGSL
jgi:threonine synthase